MKKAPLLTTIKENVFVFLVYFIPFVSAFFLMILAIVLFFGFGELMFYTFALDNFRNIEKIFTFDFLAIFLSMICVFIAIEKAKPRKSTKRAINEILERSKNFVNRVVEKNSTHITKERVSDIFLLTVLLGVLIGLVGGTVFSITIIHDYFKTNPDKLLLVMTLGGFIVYRIFYK